MFRRAAVKAFAAFAMLAMRNQSAVASEASQDAEVIATLRRAGSDLSKLHSVDFYLYVPSRTAADSIAVSLGKRGYSVTVQPAASGTLPWLALATRSMFVSVESIGSVATLMRQEVARHGGDYDGWEAGVVK